LIEPIFSLFGVPEPLAMPEAFLKRSAAGGVLVSNVNERSAYTCDDDRNFHIRVVVLRFGVERLAEFHDIHAVLDRAPARWAAPGLPCRREFVT
jgi:hypothetical protein